MSISRRSFLTAAALSPLARAAEPKIQIKARPFRLDQVRLLPGPCESLMQLNRQYLHDLEADRLVHMFKVTAGLPSSARQFGGWESTQLRGHFPGHYLSACALMHAATGDRELKAKGEAMVEEMAKCQKANGAGYLSAFPTEFFDRLKAGGKVWAPWYTYQKVMAGMLDMHQWCGSAQALTVARGMADWVNAWAGGISGEHMARILMVEFGGLNEVLYNLHAATGEPEYARLAHRFDHQRFFDPLAEGRDELKGLHMNTQVPKVIGAARRYELTGETRYRDIAAFFWRQVTQHRSYSTGGSSNNEHWRTAPGELAKELSATTEECCCTYNMLKLTRHVFSWTADPLCADYYERALLNGILGTMNPKDGMTMYFVPLASGYWKLFGTPRNSFWCCTGTGVESFAKLADSIYFHDGRSLYVNLFIASELHWRERGLVVRQETAFPERDQTTLRFKTGGPQKLAVRIRVPYWAAQGIEVRVNGKPVKSAARPGSYLEVDRTWKEGDRIDVRLPMSLRVHPMPDDPSLQAFMYGPLVLAGDLGAEGIPANLRQAEEQTELVKYHKEHGGPAPAPEFRAASGDLSSWLKPVSSKPLVFRTTGQARDITFVPLNQLFEPRYGVYWRVNGS
jgi:hypothetical protein